MYDSAVEEVEEIFDGASNLKIGDYDKDYVVFQEYGYYDFGHGRLRYAVYAVSVPTEWDAVAGHMDESTTIKVFYYTSDQNVSDGVDTSVPDHLEREDVSQELYDMFNGSEDLSNCDDGVKNTEGMVQYGLCEMRSENTGQHKILSQMWQQGFGKWNCRRKFT